MLTKGENMDDLKKKAKSLNPIMNLGKNGLNDSIIEEIRKQLKIHKLIKIKLLKTFSFEGNTQEYIKNKLNCNLVERKGNTIVFSTR